MRIISTSRCDFIKSQPLFLKPPLLVKQNSIWILSLQIVLFIQTNPIHSFIHPRETLHIHFGSDDEQGTLRFWERRGTLSNLLQIRPPHLRRIIFPITTLVSTKSNIHDDCQITENEPRTNLTSQSNVLLNPLFVKLMMILQSIKIISPLEFFVYHLMSTCTFTPKGTNRETFGQYLDLGEEGN